MSEIQILTEFKKQLILFFDDLIDQFPGEGDLVLLRIFFKDQYPIESAVKTFLHKLTTDDGKVRKMIQSRDELFFLNHSMFDTTAGKDKVERMKRLWRSDLMDAEDKKVMWKWVDAFVFLADKYAKCKTENFVSK